MKVSIRHPPIETGKGSPLLAQNRQFQYFNEPTYIYPCVLASAASLLAVKGHEAIWDDKKMKVDIPKSCQNPSAVGLYASKMGLR